MTGTVVTFYSYKGGVGRSFALANVALLLARWGYRVLCVDWDLEAPGLYHYFRPMMQEEPAGGVLDLIDEFVAKEPNPVDHTVRLSTPGTLDLLVAGREEPDYVRRIQDIDWEHLYILGLGDYLEETRNRWTTEYDFVLLDSRTGVSDIGGICTAHLPDRLVVLFTANLQSVQGAVNIATRANAARDRMPYDRPQLTVLPVLSRFDTREEYDRSEQWRRTCVEETEGLYHNWLHRAVSPEVMSRHMTVPYVSYWSFGEHLPVRQESSPGADQIGFALQTIAAVVAHDFDRTDLLAENRDAYVAAARTSNRDFPLDVRVSTPRSTLDIADSLIAELNSQGVRAERSLSGDRSLLAQIEDDARHLCLIIDRKVSRWQSAVVDMFLHRTLGQDRRVIPVLTPDAEPNTLPGYLGNLRYLRLGVGVGPAQVARTLVAQLAGKEDVDEIELVGVLQDVSEARLRPLLWELVDEILLALWGAATAGDRAQERRLAQDLALVLRTRGPHDDERVRMPEHIETAIGRLVLALDPKRIRREMG